MSKKKRMTAEILAFLVLFAVVLSAVTLFFHPKWTTDQERMQMPGLYLEDKNSIDVMFMGSCNMYTSVSPVLLYEKYGITGYDMTCPDQAMSTTYYALKDALKTQNPRVVVVEALFLTGPDTGKRGHYNRLALDYLPLSMNKIALAAETASREVDVMRQYQPSYPNKLFTFFSYIFPILEYHNRNDLSAEDLTFFFKTDMRNYTKGSWALYNYTQNDGMIWDKVHNATEPTAATVKYMPKIKELCEKKGIDLFVMKSPNYARWGHDDTYTSVAREYVEGLGIPFVDFQSEEFNDFQDYEYGLTTGRLNVYGMRKLTDKMGTYLQDNYHLGNTALTDSQKEHWDDCVSRFYKTAAEKGTPLNPGEIAELRNREEGISVRWNPADDCDRYDLYRCSGKDGGYSLIAENLQGETYLDKDVENAKGYSYYVVRREGKESGAKSAPSYGVFVAKPTEAAVENMDGTVRLSWKTKEKNTQFLIHKRMAEEFNFTAIKELSEEKAATDHIWDLEVDDAGIGLLTRFRISAMVREDNVTYFSEAADVEILPLRKPVITKCVSSGGENVISWNPLPNQGTVLVYRRAEGNEDFKLLEYVKEGETYTDKNVQPGVEYFYRIRTERTNYRVPGKSEISDTASVTTVK